MDRRVTFEDCAAAGYCAKGVRRALEDRGMSMREMIRGGIPLEGFPRDDEQFRRVAEIAEARIAAAEAAEIEAEAEE